MRHVLLAATAMWLLVMVSLAAPRRVGDASEYVAMAGRLADMGAPTFSARDMAAFTAAWADSGTGFELQTRQLPDLQGRDGRWDMPHMWLYPLLSVPFVWIARIAGGGDPWGLVALNVSMVAGLLWLAARRGAGPWTLTLFASPLVWWLDKPLADLLIACAVGGATLLWPHPASIVLLGLAAAQNPALAVVAVVFTVAAVVADPSRLRSRAWIATVVVGVICAGVAPVYYFWRLGRFSPLTLWTGTAYWPTLATLLFPLLDVNMGVVPRFPPGAVAVLVALTKRRGWRASIATPAALSAVLLLLVVSQQSNQNQGGSPDLSRYCLWLWPLTLPWLMAMDAAPTRLARAGGAALLVLGMTWSTIAFLPTRPESYRYPTPLATWFWQRHPAWTSPTIEAFAEELPTASQATSRLRHLVARRCCCTKAVGRCPALQPSPRRSRAAVRACTATPTGRLRARTPSRSSAGSPFPLPRCTIAPGRAPMPSPHGSRRVSGALAQERARSLSRTCARCSGSPGVRRGRPTMEASCSTRAMCVRAHGSPSGMPDVCTSPRRRQMDRRQRCARHRARRQRWSHYRQVRTCW